jgi:DNA polymerase III sliding clamp (beta) subunit (PCNA family)
MEMINKHNLAVAQFAADEHGRCSQDVRFTPSETMATNGHYLVRVTNVPDETIQTNARSFSIPASAFKPIKVKNGDAIELATNGTGSSWNLTTGTSTFHLEESSTTFPNVDVIMPKDEPTVTFGCDANYLAKIAKAFAAFQSDKRIATIKVSVFGPDRAFRIEANNDAGQTMTALVGCWPMCLADTIGKGKGG